MYTSEDYKFGRVDSGLEIRGFALTYGSFFQCHNYNFPRPQQRLARWYYFLTTAVNIKVAGHPARSAARQICHVDLSLPLKSMAEIASQI